MSRREELRERFNDEAFNRWLDEGISDGGHTVFDYIGADAVPGAWHGWQARADYVDFDAHGYLVEWQEDAPFGGYVQQKYETLEGAQSYRDQITNAHGATAGQRNAVIYPLHKGTPIT